MSPNLSVPSPCPKIGSPVLNPRRFAAEQYAIGQHVSVVKPCKTLRNKKGEWANDDRYQA